jgi:hypothetical protein
VLLLGLLGLLLGLLVLMLLIWLLVLLTKPSQRRYKRRTLMTVNELIEKLQGFSGDLEIMTYTASSADQPILEVSLEKRWFDSTDVVFIEGEL